MECQPPGTLAPFLDWLDSLAVIIASGVAIWGINAWRREHVGKRRIDLAEETLTLFYEARDVINGARSIMGFDTEYAEAEKIQREASGNESGPHEILIVSHRLYKRNDLFAKIRGLRYRFAAALGPGAEKPFYDLVRIRNEIVIAERGLPDVRRAYRQATDEEKVRLEPRLRELSDKVEQGGVPSDPTTQRLNVIIEQVEQKCRPIIESYGRTLTTAALTRARGTITNLPSQAWFTRLRDTWTRTLDRRSSSGTTPPPSDSSKP